MTTDDTKINFNAREAANALGVSERTLWTETKAGRVPHTKLGKRTLYPVDALRRHMNDKAVKSMAKAG